MFEWKKIVATLVGLFLLPLGVLSFGNPQWNRWIYIFQAQVLQKGGALDHAPPGYTGTWRTWHRNGAPATEAQVKDGALHGSWAQWFPDGQPACRREYAKGRPVGALLRYHPNGSLAQEGSFLEGEKEGEWVAWNENGEIQAKRIYRSGTEVPSKPDSDSHPDGILAETPGVVPLKELSTLLQGLADGTRPYPELCGKEGQVAEFRYLHRRLKEIDFEGPPAVTSGWDNVDEAEWPFFSLVYFGYAGCNLARNHRNLRESLLPAVKWALEKIRTPRITGFVAPHFGSPFGPRFHTPSVLVHGHYLYLALRYRELSGDTALDFEINRIATTLRRVYATHDQAILPSYPGMWWPTDNLPALAGLRLHGEVFGGSHYDICARWVNAMRAHYLEADTGLMCAYVDPGSRIPKDVPRGVAITFAIPFLAELDAAFARDQYLRAKEHLVWSTGPLAAVREFVPGKEGTADVDSGPLVMGFGPAASGFALAAAASMGDRDLFDGLQLAATIAGLPEKEGDGLAFRGMPLVGQTVVLFGKTSPLPGDGVLPPQPGWAE